MKVYPVSAVLVYFIKVSSHTTDISFALPGRTRNHDARVQCAKQITALILSHSYILHASNTLDTAYTLRWTLRECYSADTRLNLSESESEEDFRTHTHG